MSLTDFRYFATKSGKRMNVTSGRPKMRQTKYSKASNVKKTLYSIYKTMGLFSGRGGGGGGVSTEGILHLPLRRLIFIGGGFISAFYGMQVTADMDKKNPSLLQSDNGIIP